MGFRKLSLSEAFLFYIKFIELFARVIKVIEVRQKSAPRSDIIPQGYKFVHTNMRTDKVICRGRFAPNELRICTI